MNIDYGGLGLANLLGAFLGIGLAVVLYRASSLPAPQRDLVYAVVFGVIGGGAVLLLVRFFLGTQKEYREITEAQDAMLRHIGELHAEHEQDEETVDDGEEDSGEG